MKNGGYTTGQEELLAQDAKALWEAADLLRPLCRLDRPLTLDELREMDGEPVWVAFTPDTDGECLAIWALISVDKENNEIFLLNSIGGSSAYEEVCVDIESIYRRKS